MRKINHTKAVSSTNSYLKESLHSFDLYIALIDRYKRYDKSGKYRLMRKHCHMAGSQVIKQFPEHRKFDRGTRVFTYDIGDKTAFTCKPKQKGCRNYTFYKTAIVLKQTNNRSLF
jgi:hypothetical protein